MSCNRYIGILLGCIFLATGFARPVSAAEPAPTIPIKVTSDKLSYDATGQQVRFEGNVHVTHPDAQLWAEKIVIILAKKDSKEKTATGANSPQMDPGQIDRIIADGKVRVELKDGKSGSCDTATYNLGTGILTMEGQPVLRDGNNSIQGKLINFYVKENKSEVIGSSGVPVEALFIAPKRLK